MATKGSYTFIGMCKERIIWLLLRYVLCLWELFAHDMYVLLYICWNSAPSLTSIRLPHFVPPSSGMLHRLQAVDPDGRPAVH